jgi:hypothetical protein
MGPIFATLSESLASIVLQFRTEDKSNRGALRQPTWQAPGPWVFCYWPAADGCAFFAQSPQHCNACIASRSLN